VEVEGGVRLSVLAGVGAERSEEFGTLTTAKVLTVTQTTVCEDFRRKTPSSDSCKASHRQNSTGSLGGADPGCLGSTCSCVPS
jgi:hypothetical protein